MTAKEIASWIPARTWVRLSTVLRRHATSMPDAVRLLSCSLLLSCLIPIAWDWVYFTTTDSDVGDVVGEYAGVLLEYDG